MAEQQPLEADSQNELDRLIEESERRRIVFLKTELQTCFTLIGLVETERDLGETSHAA